LVQPKFRQIQVHTHILWVQQPFLSARTKKAIVIESRFWFRVKPMSKQFRLLREARLFPLFMTQFLGAFNDNLLKNAMVILIAFRGGEFSDLDPGLLVNACAGLFILPFFLFSASAGQLADKYEKARLIRLVKILELAIVLVATLGFYRLSLPWLLIALFLMGTHSALFGPLKYAILPQHLRPEELVGGNALIESSTFLAILLGTIVGGLLIASTEPLWAGVICVVVAGLGYLSSRRIPDAPAADPALVVSSNPFAETWRNLRDMRQDKGLFTIMAAISWFWFYGAMFLSQIPAYTRDVGGNESVTTLFLVCFSVGIGIGSLLCERMSQGRIEPGIVPIGMLGLSVFAADLYFATPEISLTGDAMQFIAQPDSLRILIDLLLIGVAGGIYCVPLYAMLQDRSRATHRSRSIAATNILNSLFMVAAALLAMVLLGQGLRAVDLFLLTGVLNLLAGVWIHRNQPEFIKRMWPRSKQ
jgi:MFS family permease